MVFVGNTLILTMARCSNSNYQELAESPKKPYVGQKRMASLLSEAQHRVVQVAFSGVPSGYEKSEALRPPIPRSRPNRFIDLPEIRDTDMTSIRYIPSNSGQSSPDPVSPLEHVVHVVCYHFQSHSGLAVTLRIVIGHRSVDDFHTRAPLSGRVVSVKSRITFSA
jgi:hypothetical protein